MKKIIGLIAFLTFVINVKSQDTSQAKMQGVAKNTEKYCAQIKAGRLTMMRGGKAATTPISLNNGITISIDCILTKSDGSRTLLVNGECVDREGNIEKAEDKSEKK